MLLFAIEFSLKNNTFLLKGYSSIRNKAINGEINKAINGGRNKAINGGINNAINGATNVAINSGENNEITQRDEIKYYCFLNGIKKAAN